MPRKISKEQNPQVYELSSSKGDKTTSNVFATSDAERIWARSSTCEKSAWAIYCIASVVLGLMTFAYAAKDNDFIVVNNHIGQARAVFLGNCEFHYKVCGPMGQKVASLAYDQLDLKLSQIHSKYEPLHKQAYELQLGLQLTAIAAIILSIWKRHVSPIESKGSYNLWRGATIINTALLGGLSLYGRQMGYLVAGPTGAALAGTQLVYGAFETLSWRYH